mmetsp:Transcript_28898/g.61021  ORF Transcript_28898/g.61021 Transcript_28898/m.61021 type:complete len:390 (-) Transcript_28898:858-2027(-)
MRIHPPPNAMAASTDSSPSPDNVNPATSAIHNVVTQDGPGDDIADPVVLFSQDYDANANDGRLSNIPSNSSGSKRPASPRKSAPKVVRLPAKKRTNVAASPARLVLDAAANAAAAVARAVVTSVNNGSQNILMPPSITRGDPLPTSSMADLPALAQATTTKKKSTARKKPTVTKKNAIKTTSPRGLAMIGLVPKTAFFPWMRNFLVPKHKITEAEMKTEVNAIRSSIMYHFSKSGKCQKHSPIDEIEDSSRRVTRSSVEEDDEWIVDMDAANCNVTDTRHLSRYALEHIITLPLGTPILLLFDVDDEEEFSRKGELIESIQQLPRRTISGRQYYQLQCTISDLKQNEYVVTGRQLDKEYSLPQFKADFKSGNGGFHVDFKGCNSGHHFN